MTNANDDFEPDFSDLTDDNETTETASASLQAESLAMKKMIRDQLQNDIEAYLQRGGVVKNIADNVRADPPRKPDLSYGGGPI